MDKRGIFILCVAMAGSAAAQVGSDSIAPVNEPLAIDSLRPDTVEALSYTSRMQANEEHVVREATRYREERASKRSSPITSSPRASSSASSSTGKSVRRGNGATLSIERATDPEGRKHWKRMNRKSTRQARDCPPGTVPAF